MKINYLASPYTKSPFFNYEAVCWFLAQDSKLNYFSPIVHWHWTAIKYHLPLTVEKYREYNAEMQSRCDMLSVLCLPGWERSIGVNYELDLAEQLGQNILYLPYEGPKQFPVC